MIADWQRAVLGWRYACAMPGLGSSLKVWHDAAFDIAVQEGP